MTEKFDGSKDLGGGIIEIPNEFTEMEILILKMQQDIKRALIMNGATEEQADEIIRNAKITITDENGVERPIDN